MTTPFPPPDARIAALRKALRSERIAAREALPAATRQALTERIETPRRIRDLIEGEDGRIYIWSDDATIDVIGPAKGTEAGLAFAREQDILPG